VTVADSERLAGLITYGNARRLNENLHFLSLFVYLHSALAFVTALRCGKRTSVQSNGQHYAVLTVPTGVHMGVDPWGGGQDT